MEAVLAFLGTVLVGAFVGTMAGLLGIGGGAIMVPLFRLGYGMSAFMSTATSLFVIVPTSVSGVFEHIKRKTCIPKLGVAMGLGGACTSVLGVALAQISPSWLVMLAAAIIVMISAYNMFRKAFEIKPEKRAANDAASEQGAPIEQGKQGERAAQGEQAEQAELATEGLAGQTAQTAQSTSAQSAQNEQKGAVEYAREQIIKEGAKPLPDVPELSRKQLVRGAGIGMVAGLASGYVGVGGGFIMVPMMLSLLHITMKHASGTSLIAILILAIPGTITQIMLGNVNLMAGIAMTVGSIPGALFGAKLVRYIPERALRLVFGCFLVLASIILVLNELTVL